jgi:hypothetical protein
MSTNDQRKAEAILKARWIVQLMDDPIHQAFELSIREFQAMFAHDYGVKWSTRTISEARKKAKERLPYGYSGTWNPPQRIKRWDNWLAVQVLGDLASIPPSPGSRLPPLTVDEDGHWLEDEDEDDTSSWFMVPRPVSYQG